VITAFAPGASWDAKGNEAAVARIAVDGRYNQSLIVFGNERSSTYQVLLGNLKEGDHTLIVERDERSSAPSTRFVVRDARVTVISSGSSDFLAVEHAPILYARADTLGAFTDAPLLMWYEMFRSQDDETIQYSIVFSNEDGGTPTDALMARWGRTTDIEYIYRVTLDRQDHIKNEVFLGIDEKGHYFRGQKENLHPLILDATPNNDFTDTGFSPVRYRFKPIYADLSRHSREELMDHFPWTYGVMEEELRRERKLRSFGKEDGTKVSDPKNYLYIEMKAENSQAGLVAWVKLKNQNEWYSSYRGRWDFVISRSGWYRTTVELPPGTTAGSIQYLALECVEVSPWNLILDEDSVRTFGHSVLESLSKAFLLDPGYRPAETLFEVHSPLTFHPGELHTFLPAGR
jgi:hypothetical protein